MKRVRSVEKPKSNNGETNGATSQAVVSNNWSRIIEKSLTANGCWDRDTFEELPDVLFCIRQLMAFAVGISFGVFEVTGFTGILWNVVIILLLPFVYYSRFLNVNIEDYGAMELASAGLQSSFGLFMLCWILTYSIIYH